MDWWLHNPIADMYGPHFLLFYACVIAVTLLACWWRVIVSDTTADLPPLPLPGNPDPYEIAYLRGGENEVTRLVIFDLMQRGYLQAPEKATATEHQLEQAPQHPDPRHLSPLEREVFDFFSVPRTAAYIFQESFLPADLRKHCRNYEERLHQDQLLCPPEAKQVAWRMRWTGALIILGLGGYRLALALAKGRTKVGFLILIGVISLPILVFLCRPPRLSHRGRDYLKRLQDVFERLKPEAASTIAGVAKQMVPLVVALFGVRVLEESPYAYIEPKFYRGGWAWGGGGGCGGGGCGGGCGGGGGGGCGGCGGGCGG